VFIFVVAYFVIDSVRKLLVHPHTCMKYLFILVFDGFYLDVG